MLRRVAKPSTYCDRWRWQIRPKLNSGPPQDHNDTTNDDDKAWRDAISWILSCLDLIKLSKHPASGFDDYPPSSLHDWGSRREYGAQWGCKCMHGLNALLPSGNSLNSTDHCPYKLTIRHQNKARAPHAVLQKPVVSQSTSPLLAIMSDAAFALFFADFSLCHNFLNVDAARQAWSNLSLQERALWQSISEGAYTDTRPANSTPPKRDHYPRAHYDSTKSAVPQSSRPKGVTKSYSRTGRAVKGNSTLARDLPLTFPEDRNATGTPTRQKTSTHPVLVPNQSSTRIDDTDIHIPEIASVEDFWNFVEPRK